MGGGPSACDTGDTGDTGEHWRHWCAEGWAVIQVGGELTCGSTSTVLKA
eukprot:CAMPEP_0182536366 /NCGR_PEP_ID=MMETSP1323-20130603/19870_1 /TAXON_ID=236787 /ORGANISM="Florenciella parvula, Strain RCC1693" /LENGTH=48 /DNA_ID= /DNA_START= /DNA_END= /DNA_ORIENTATION=